MIVSWEITFVGQIFFCAGGQKLFSIHNLFFRFSIMGNNLVRCQWCAGGYSHGAVPGTMGNRWHHW